VLFIDLRQWGEPFEKKYELKALFEKLGYAL
jgi:hypothetical protein